jgi:NAD(P)-dependent dehydrogenase (short-subunit alcohol dehydrogenase family)
LITRAGRRACAGRAVCSRRIDRDHRRDGARDRPYPGLTTITMAHGAVTSTVRTQAVELAPVRVNAIHPGRGRGQSGGERNAAGSGRSHPSADAERPAGDDDNVAAAALSLLDTPGSTQSTGRWTAQMTPIVCSRIHELLRWNSSPDVGEQESSRLAALSSPLERAQPKAWRVSSSLKKCK